MNHSRLVSLALGGLALAGGFGAARVVGMRPAHAQGLQLVRNFYGEANEEVRAVKPVPSGMSCAGQGVGTGLTVQTTEPKDGFTGACLMDHAYGGGLPTVCYSPSNATYTIGTLGPTETCKIPSSEVAQPDWELDVQAGQIVRTPVAHTRTLETCVPHLGHVDATCYLAPDQAPQTDDLPNGDCPCGTKLVSHSCCTQMGAAMTSNGKTASAPAYFTAPPAFPVYGQ